MVFSPFIVSVNKAYELLVKFIEVYIAINIIPTLNKDRNTLFISFTSLFNCL